jgi:hypothetical protein
MKKVVISQNQASFISKVFLNEALGVPQSILDSGEKLYDQILTNLKSITEKEEEYEFTGNLDFEIGDKKKKKITSYELTVRTETFENYNEKPQVISMAVGTNFAFDRTLLKKVTEPSTELHMSITFAVSEDWEPNELYEFFQNHKVEQTASLAHEIKHMYDKQVRPTAMVGHDAEYQATQHKDSFGIPIIDHEFFRNMYFVAVAENLVRTTEIASQMKSLNVTKKNFENFLKNERTYKELVGIKNFTFDYFISELKNQMNRVDALLDYIGENPNKMTEDEKIKSVLEVVYISIVNNRLKFFMDMTSRPADNFLRFGQQLGALPSFMGKDVTQLEKVDEVRENFLKFTTRFQKDPIKFFQYECKKFNFVADKLIRKIIKLYDMANDDETQVTESIQNWDLHQKLMEKKYGKRKIHTKYLYK